MNNGYQSWYDTQARLAQQAAAAAPQSRLRATIEHDITEVMPNAASRSVDALRRLSALIAELHGILHIVCPLPTGQLGSSNELLPRAHAAYY